MIDESDPSFIPKEQRNSNNVGFGDYAGKIVKAVVVTKGAALAGGLAGDKMKGPVGAAWGATIGGIGGAMYEGHEHWKPIKGTQERIAAMLPEVKAELNPAHAQKEIALQQQITEGLKQRQNLFTEMVGKPKPVSIEPRGNAVDAIIKDHIIETKGPGRS